MCTDIKSILDVGVYCKQMLVEKMYFTAVKRQNKTAKCFNALHWYWKVFSFKSTRSLAYLSNLTSLRDSRWPFNLIWSQIAKHNIDFECDLNWNKKSFDTSSLISSCSRLAVKLVIWQNENIHLQQSEKGNFKTALKRQNN